MRRGGGAIVNLASVAGSPAAALISARTSRASTRWSALTRRGVDVPRGGHPEWNAVLSAPVETRMMRSLEEGFLPGQLAALKQMMASQIRSGAMRAD